MISRESLIKLLEQKEQVLLINEISVDKLSEMFGSDFAAMKGYSQNNPHHCYDLLTHTLRSVNNLDIFCSNPKELPFLKVAALYHDVGKPSVVKQKNGRNVFYGHAAKSAEILKPILVQMGFDFQEIERIMFYVKHHDDFISFKLNDEMPPKKNPYIKLISPLEVKKQLSQTIKKCETSHEYLPSKVDYINLLSLCCADASAQSEMVIVNGIDTDGRDKKIRRMKAIQSIIEKISF